MRAENTGPGKGNCTTQDRKHPPRVDRSRRVNADYCRRPPDCAADRTSAGHGADPPMELTAPSRPDTHPLFAVPGNQHESARCDTSRYRPAAAFGAGRKPSEPGGSVP
ncbi:hypothetical protein GCM10010423_41580 [Streptomyces levis]|uniref:Uncharacterized protein n=1 Tax=Streptomyces levis TaxID=285566 RepID=A0ABN3NWH6_9ACTN